MMKLVQLPNGMWIDPSSVLLIHTVGPRPPFASSHELLPDNVILTGTQGAILAIPCESKQEAQELADKIADIINNAC